jgi:hypothetical protein
MILGGCGGAVSHAAINTAAAHQPVLRRAEALVMVYWSGRRAFDPSALCSELAAHILPTA